MTDYTQLTALVVDDDAFTRDVIRATFEHLQLHSVVTVAGGHEAIELILKNDPPIDVIVCDLRMPGMDGVELLRHLAELDFDQGIILISGAEESILRAAVNLARAHYLNLLGSMQKPGSIDAMAAFLDNYTDRHDRRVNTRAVQLSLKELEEGLAAGHLILYYQPQIDVKSGRVVGMEALARWLHPTRGLLPPSTFIPLLEQSDLIHAFSYAVIDQALTQTAKWNGAGYDVRVAINLSTANLTDSNLPTFLSNGCKRLQIDPRKIALEITETHFDEDTLLSLEVLTRLRLQGFGLSIDDFGTGYSSLDRLKQTPFDELKIDGGFIHGTVHDKAARAILESSVTLGDQLSLTVLAEGVEDSDDWALCRQVGCQLAQGYYIAKPMPAADMDNWLAQWQGLASLTQ